MYISLISICVKTKEKKICEYTMPLYTFPLVRCVCYFKLFTAVGQYRLILLSDGASSESFTLAGKLLFKYH